MLRVACLIHSNSPFQPLYVHRQSRNLLFLLKVMQTGVNSELNATDFTYFLKIPNILQGVPHHIGSYTGCPTSYWILYSSKLRFSGLIRKLKNNQLLWKLVKGYNMKICHKENSRFFEYYMRFLALRLGDNLIWYGMLCMLDAVFNYLNENIFLYILEII